MANCNACGVGLNAEVERTTRKLLLVMDDTRKEKLAETYQGPAPDVLCAGCFNLGLTVVNEALS